jgi:hypothetical protein
VNGWTIAALAALGLLLLRRRAGGPAGVDSAAAAARRQLAIDGAWPDHVAPSIEVVEVRAHTFADSCLGVAAPDEVCAQVATPGHLVELRAMGRIFEYHVAGDRARLCPPCSARLNGGGAA